MNMKSIKQQLMTISFLLIATALLATVSLSYYFVSADYEKIMRKNNSGMAESLALNISQFMQNAYNITQNISINADTTSFVPERQKGLLVNTVKNYPYFQLIAAHKLNGDQTARSVGNLANRANRWWFKKFLTEQKAYITKSYYSVASGTPVVTIVHGINSNDALQGVMMVDLETSAIQEMVEKFNAGAGSYAYVLDGEGVVVAHPDKQQVAEIYNYKDLKKTLTLKDAQGNMLKDQNGNPKTEEQAITLPQGLKTVVENVMQGRAGDGEYKDELGDTYVCSYRSIALPGASESWSLIVVQKKESALAFVRNIAVKNAAVGFLMLLLATVCMIRFAKLLTKPLLFILEATNKVKAGDLTLQIAVKQFTADNEITRLAENFNVMVENLHELAAEVHGSTKLVANSAEELTAGSEQSAMAASQVADAITKIAQAAERQLQIVNKTTGVVEQMSSGVQQVAANYKAMREWRSAR